MFMYLQKDYVPVKEKTCWPQIFANCIGSYVQRGNVYKNNLSYTCFILSIYPLCFVVFIGKYKVLSSEYHIRHFKNLSPTNIYKPWNSYSAGALCFLSQHFLPLPLEATLHLTAQRTK